MRLIRFIPVLFLFLFSSVQVLAQNSALIIIDIQDFYFPDGDLPLEEPLAAAMNAGLLLEQFRKQGDKIVHIRHNYEPGGAIHQYVDPASHELVISKDQVNAFRDTSLDEVLRADSITKLVICGMQTHMCVEAAVRAGNDLGYEIVLVEDACATRSLNYNGTQIEANDVHNSTLATLKSYARIIKVSDYLIETSGIKY